jgi:diguanylate cyclase (GGDEF)-like protein
VPESLRVLIADDDEQARRLVRRILEPRGIACLEAGDGQHAAAIARDARPDVVLLDVHMPAGGAEAIALLRADHRTSLIPVIVLTGDARPDSVVHHLLAGADDHVTKPFTGDELEARIVVASRRRELLGSISPLTGLPGNVALTAEVARRLAAGEPTALLHIDIDDFKPFNDRYGYVRGDAAISAVADVLRAEADVDGSLVAHIGGDDFAVVTDPGRAADVARRVLDAFAAVRDGLHDAEDLVAGFYTARSRTGSARPVGLLALTIGVACSSSETPSATALADAAAEMKGVAKRTPGPSVAVDRRRVPASSPKT